MEFFFLKPSNSHYLMDISRTIGLSHTSVKKNLVALVKSEILTESIEKKGERKFPVYKANTNNERFKSYKIMYNLTILLESGTIDFIEKILMPKSIVIFGSYRRGEDTEKSDIDIFVECAEDKLNLDNFEKKLQRKIQLHFNSDFNSYPKELKNNIINGVLMKGFLEGYE